MLARFTGNYVSPQVGTLAQLLYTDIRPPALASLHQSLFEPGNVPAAKLTVRQHLAAGVSEALEFVHSCGIIHR